MKNNEARIKRFCKIAQPHIYVRFRGIGERPNKQENVGFRESGNPALFVKWVPLCIACQDAPESSCAFQRPFPCGSTKNARTCSKLLISSQISDIIYL